MKCQKRRIKRGFTLIEIIVVMAVISVLAAVATPSVIKYMDAGRQVNRTSIARTLYLAAQNQLTEMRITKRLESEFGGLTSNVFDELERYPGFEWPDTEENKANVNYISKPAGVPLSSEAQQVYDLLAPVVKDQLVLNDAILIEFNIKTGIVLSVFYSDVVGTLGYTGSGKEDDVTGKRGMGADGYESAFARSQGYYGVGETGTVSAPVQSVSINLYDSYTTPNNDVHGGNRNLLYATVLIPNTAKNPVFRINGVEVLAKDTITISGIEGYTGFYWILDSFGDALPNVSIGSDYGWGGNIKITLTDDNGLHAESNERNPYYFDNSGTVKSARHLNNVRLYGDKDFTQGDDIDLYVKANFAPIPLLSGSYNGNGYAISNLTINTTADNTGLFSAVSGTVDALTLINPSVTVTGTANTGAVCGVLSGTVKGAYVAYTDGGKGVTGENNVGGLVGTNNGTLAYSTFISPTTAVHITGNATATTGGLVGVNEGTLTDNQFLALAPGYGTGTIRPIAGTNSRTVTSQYYLSGTAIRPEPAQLGGEEYNTEPANGTGEPAGSNRIFYMLSGENWALNGGLSATVTLDPQNTIYPYAFYKLNGNATAAAPDWPIAGEENGVSELVYYELYSDNTWGFEGSKDTSKPLLNDKLVKNDGYAVEMSFLRTGFSYTLTIGDKSFEVTPIGTACTVTENNVTQPWAYKSFTADTGETMCRLYIPNAVLEGAADATGRVRITLKNVGTLIDESMNPLFAPKNGIRSPRHIDNIDKVASTDYTQQLDVDFALYCKELTGGAVPAASTNTGLTFTGAVVANTFSRTYDGNGKSIANLTITGSADGTGLFSSNTGTIKNVTLYDAHISGGNNVGGIAAVNGAGGKIENCTVTTDMASATCTITGTSNVGGITGTNSGTITDCKAICVSAGNVSAEYAGGIAGINSGSITRSFVGEGAHENIVDGAAYVGGIAGYSTGNITVSYVSYTRVGHAAVTGGVTASTYVGGIAGYMDGGTVSDVFYNYGNNGPQTEGWINAITGQADTTGGLVGYIDAGTLSNAYSDAYFGSGNNLLIGGKNSKVANLPTNVIYLKDDGYNSGTSQYGGKNLSVEQLRSATLPGELGAYWTTGSGWNTKPNPTTYTYPVLSGLVEPLKWPMPHTTIFSFVYYEIYDDGSYGLWRGVGGDQLSYDKKVVEDGYMMFTTNTSGGNEKLSIVDDAGKRVYPEYNNVQHFSGKIEELGNLNCFIFPLNDLIKCYETYNLDHINPLHVVVVNGSYSYGDPLSDQIKFDGYINPFFAKSVYAAQVVGTIDFKQHQFSIRSPRHLNNIGSDDSTLKGHYIQEIDIDFENLNDDSDPNNKGYCNYTYSKEKNNDPAKRTKGSPIDISKSVVPGTFTGSYTALSSYDKQVKAIKNLTISNQNGDDISIFRQTGSGAVIENLRLLNNSITGRNNIAGLTVSNDGGTIRNITAEEIKLNAPNGSASGLTGENTGIISGCTLKNTTVTGDGGAYGIAGSNTDGTIRNITIESLTVTAQNGVRSGITGESTGTIDTVAMIDVKVTGGGSFAAAGVAIKQEGGSIKNIECNDLTVYSQNGSGAGIACESNGAISNSVLDGFTITGMSYTGGIAGNSTGSIKNTTVQNGSVTGTSGSCTGGIAGSANTIEDCLVMNVTVNGVNNLGGAAGEVTGTGALIARTGVMYSTVTSNGGANVGGIAGINSGEVKDVLLISVAKDAAGEAVIPVKGNTAGGIVGRNNGTVTCAFYLAPAPQSTNDGKITIYPIVGGGNPALTINNGTESEKETCFYLTGSRYSLDKDTTWVEKPYNRGLTANPYTVIGGGRGLITKFIDKEWLNTISGVTDDTDLFTAWRQPTPTELYPYPLLNGVEIPADWPISSSPVRLDQVDEPDWEATLPTTNRAINVDFINGDFADAYLSGDGIVETVGSNGSRRVYIDSLSVYGWNTRPVNSSDYTGNYSTSGIPRWRIFEFQEPVIKSGTDMYGQYAYTNYQGKANTTLDVNNSIYRYAELNAEVQGTLYQICDTTPGTQFYYSFYHTTRLGGTAENNVTPVNNVYIDRMNFYLTGVSDTAQMAEDSKLTLIRPCWSPRTAASGNNIVNTNGSSNGDPMTTYNNPAVRYTVAYGNGTNVYGNNYEFNLEYYRKAYPDLPVGKDLPDNGRPYIYDVWISDYGYGITFWSTSNVTAASIGNSVKSINDLKTLQSDAQNHVMGYWSISFGWKQYYGLYTVPEGQKRTEFAYQSRRNDAQNGNYLDGITFKSPGFLSIDKYARIDGKDVRFVQPNETITIDLYVKNWGEVTTDSIEIIDRLAPYHEYLKYLGNVKVSRVDAAGKETADITTGVTIGFNEETQTLSVKPNIALKTNDEIKVSFEVQVRETCLTSATPGGDPSETLLYYIKNQAVVTYKDTEFTGYSSTKRNASGPEPVQIFIDPVKLDKTVVPVPDAESPYTYEVTLSVIANVMDTQNGVTTVGLISDVIPKGFTIKDTSGLANSVCTKEPDGSTRIIIRNVNLNKDKTRIDLSYTVCYSGEGYGVTYTSVASDYKYLYDIGDNDPLNVMLEFPKLLVGIDVRTKDDAFTFDVNSLEKPVSGADPSIVFNITDNDWDKEPLTADNYAVNPEILLFYVEDGETEGEKIYKQAKINTGGYYEFLTAEYMVTLLGKTGELVFTPLKGKPGTANENEYVPGTYEFYYKIGLTATKPGSDSFELSSQLTKVTVTVEDYILAMKVKIKETTEALNTAVGDAELLLAEAELLLTPDTDTEPPEEPETPEEPQTPDETLIALRDALLLALQDAEVLLQSETVTLDIEAETLEELETALGNALEQLEAALETLVTATEALRDYIDSLPTDETAEEGGEAAQLPLDGALLLAGLPLVMMKRTGKRGRKRA